MRSDYDRCEALKARGETRAWLGVVFVGILKLDESDRAEVMTELTKASRATGSASLMKR